MTPKLRNEIFMYATGQTKEPSENAKLIFDELQKRYGTDVASKIENNVLVANDDIYNLLFKKLGICKKYTKISF